MELRQLRQFIAVAETGSFTRGAERLSVSQSALSAGIAKLEAECGTLLFARDKRNVVLTRAGRRLLSTAEAVVAECEAAKSDLQSLERQQRLKLGVINTLAIDKVARLVEHFRANCLEVALDVIDGSAEEIRDYLKQGRIDIALSLANRDDKPGRKIMQRHLFTESYVLVTAKKHRLAGRRSVSFHELQGEALIARTHCDHRHVLARLLKQHGVKMKPMYRTNQDNRALVLVAAGLGVAFMPGHYEMPGVKRVALADEVPGRDIGLLWTASRETEALESFARFADTHNWFATE